MLIEVNGKDLITTQINGLIVKGENNADVIEINIPSVYGGQSIEDKRFILRMVNSQGTYYEKVLEKELQGGIIKLTWVVTSPFTSVDGILKIALSVEDDEGYKMSTMTSKINIGRTVVPGFPISPEQIFEDYLQEIRIRAEQTEKYSSFAEESQNAAAASQVAAESAKTAAETARDAAALSQSDALASKNAAAASKTAAETAKTAAETARDTAVTAADDAVKRMQAFEAGAIAAQVETNKNEISDLKNYLKIERYGVKIAKGNSSPAGAMEYMYDAVGKQPAYMDFATGNFNYGDWNDAFFIKQNRPVMLDTSWNVVEELDKTDQTKKINGSLSSISDELSNLNAFAEFPQVWYKTWEDSTHQYFVISNVQYDETYKCDVCKDAAGKIADKWYFPMFDGSLISGKMRSLADKAVSVSKTAAQEIGYCTLHGASWYTLDKEQIHVFVMLAELIAKNRNSQQAFGDQVSLGTNTAGINTGSLKSFGQFRGYNDGIHATKMFYCETGSLGYTIRYAGHITNANSEQLCKNHPPYDINGADYTNTGIIVTTNGYIKDMLFNNDGIFGKTTGGSATTYWPDAHYFAPNCYARWRGYWNAAAAAGLRYVYVASAASIAHSTFASALSGRKPV